MQPVIIQASKESKIGFECYGGARELWRSHDPEVILVGGYETGKTYPALMKLHLLLSKYKNAQALMVRKTYQSLVNSAVVTYERKVLPYPIGDTRCAVRRYGGEYPAMYIYPNGSQLRLGGMDKPDKFLSSEFDFIYVNQVEELRLDDWEKLTGRCTGRAGNTPYAQIFGDCNPAYPQHWILKRPQIKLITTRHEDNPTLYDPTTGEITERGKLTLSRLDALTGVRYKRGRLGLWSSVEGMVYEDWQPDIHVIDRFDIPWAWRRYRCIDFGYRNPFVCGWWAEDEDGRLYLYREIYMTGRTVLDHAQQIKALSGWEQFEANISDHDASDRATLEENGITTIAAIKDVKLGIERVQERLRVQGDGKPRLFLLRDSLVETDYSLKERFVPTCTEEEFPAYVYPQHGETKADDEKPVKLYDHGMDMTRYMVAHLDIGGGNELSVTRSPLEDYRG